MIPDKAGVTAADLSCAQQAALDIIDEMKAEDDADGLRDWAIVVTDETERFALVLPLYP